MLELVENDTDKIVQPNNIQRLVGIWRLVDDCTAKKVRDSSVPRLDQRRAGLHTHNIDELLGSGQERLT